MLSAQLTMLYSRFTDLMALNPRMFPFNSVLGLTIGLLRKRILLNATHA